MTRSSTCRATFRYDADPYARVGRNEMADWCKENGLQIDPLLDAGEIQPALDKLFCRLKREFPQENWRSSRKSITEVL